MAGEIVFHIPEHLRRGFARRSKKDFYKRLWGELTDRGGQVRIEHYEDQSARRIDPEDGNLHFVNNGNLCLPNVLNTGIAYLDRFWQVDPRGILSESSIRDEEFDPARVDRKAAWSFFQAMRSEYVSGRRSRYAQPREVEPIRRGVIAVFLQGDSQFTNRARLCSTPEMIRSVAAGAGDRAILVKPHPLKVDPADILAVHDLATDGVNIRITEANVHDILARASVSVSIASACSFEGFLHKTPAILYGKADFHHFAETVTDPGGFPEAFEAALSRKRGYSLYVHWYLKERCIWTKEPEFFDKISARMAAQGFDPKRLGLKAA